jgi:hypothetical protein
MPRVNDGGQQSFEDKVLMDEELAAACDDLLEKKEAASDYRKANAKIKERLPGVKEPTRFLVNEQYFVEVTPYSVEGHEVGGGERQRMRVKAATSAQD